MKSIKELVGERIKMRRKEKGFATQEALSRELGIDRSRVSRWESGENLPDPEYRAKILSILDMTEDELYASEPSSVFSFDEGVLIVRSFQSATPDIQAAVRHLLGLDPADFAHDVLEQAEAYLQSEASAKPKISKR